MLMHDKKTTAICPSSFSSHERIILVGAVIWRFLFRIAADYR